MKWSNIMLGISIGVIGSVFLKKELDQKTLPAEKALNSAKQALKKIGPIDGSWIHMIPETISKNQISYDVFRGGISRNIKGEIKQYEFLVDATTGTIIEVTELD